MKKINISLVFLIPKMYPRATECGGVPLPVVRLVRDPNSLLGRRLSVFSSFRFMIFDAFPTDSSYQNRPTRSRDPYRSDTTARSDTECHVHVERPRTFADRTTLEPSRRTTRQCSLCGDQIRCCDPVISSTTSNKRSANSNVWIQMACSADEPTRSRWIAAAFLSLDQ